MKMLYILNISEKVDDFSKSSMMAAKKLGIDFHIAGNWEYKSDKEIIADEEKLGIKIHQIDFYRNPLNKKNINALKSLIKLINNEKYDMIHCNTPIGGLLGRLAGSKCKVKNIIYEAHGFHFYKGAPFKNWFIYYPIEKLLARKTDLLITMNKEDYNLARNKFHLRNKGKTYFVHGVGVDTNIKNYYVKDDIRDEFNISQNDFVLLSVGRLEKNKNNSFLIRSLVDIKNNNVKLIFCGEGDEKEELVELVNKLCVSNKVVFLGQRDDMDKIYRISDVLVSSSLREGLPRSIMEAMAVGLPCVVSRIRGNIDLIEDGVNGFCFDLKNTSEFINKINMLLSDNLLYKTMSINNLNKIKSYDFNVVKNEMAEIYRCVL